MRLVILLVSICSLVDGSFTTGREDLSALRETCRIRRAALENLLPTGGSKSAQLEPLTRELNETENLVARLDSLLTAERVPLGVLEALTLGDEKTFFEEAITTIRAHLNKTKKAREVGNPIAGESIEAQMDSIREEAKRKAKEGAGSHRQTAEVAIWFVNSVAEWTEKKSTVSCSRESGPEIQVFVDELIALRNDALQKLPTSNSALSFPSPEHLAQECAFFFLLSPDTPRAKIVDRLVKLKRMVGEGNAQGKMRTYSYLLNNFMHLRDSILGVTLQPMDELLAAQEQKLSEVQQFLNRVLLSGSLADSQAIRETIIAGSSEVLNMISFQGASLQSEHFKYTSQAGRLRMKSKLLEARLLILRDALESSQAMKKPILVNEVEIIDVLAKTHAGIRKSYDKSINLSVEDRRLYVCVQHLRLALFAEDAKRIINSHYATSSVGGPVITTRLLEAIQHARRVQERLQIDVKAVAGIPAFPQDPFIFDDLDEVSFRIRQWALYRHLLTLEERSRFDSAIQTLKRLQDERAHLSPSQSSSSLKPVA